MIAYTVKGCGFKDVAQIQIEIPLSMIQRKGEVQGGW